MKRHTLTILAVAAAMLSAGYVLGQNKSGKAAPAAEKAAPQTKQILIATLNGVQANREFTSNVQLMQEQRRVALELNEAKEKEKDAKKKAELQKQIDAILTKLNENNAAMQKAYGFSLTRNYIMEVEKAHIYLQVTEEEAAKIEKAQKEQKAAGAKK